MVGERIDYPIYFQGWYEDPKLTVVVESPMTMLDEADLKVFNFDDIEKLVLASYKID